MQRNKFSFTVPNAQEFDQQIARDLDKQKTKKRTPEEKTFQQFLDHKKGEEVRILQEKAEERRIRNEQQRKKDRDKRFQQEKIRQKQAREKIIYQERIQQQTLQQQALQQQTLQQQALQQQVQQQEQTLQDQASRQAQESQQAKVDGNWSANYTITTTKRPLTQEDLSLNDALILFLKDKSPLYKQTFTRTYLNRIEQAIDEQNNLASLPMSYVQTPYNLYQPAPGQNQMNQQMQNQPVEDTNYLYLYPNPWR